MRFLILILIFVNLGVWTYLNRAYFFQMHSPSDAEIEADKLKLLNKHQLDALNRSLAPTDPTTNNSNKQAASSAKNSKKVTSKPEKTAKAVTRSCYRWGAFNDANIAKAQAFVSQLGLKADLKKTSQTKVERYWVYMPPLSSAAEAQRTAESLKRQGITDIYVLNGSEWRNAISFGVFSENRYAENMLKILRNKGINNVLKTPRGKSTSNRYHLMVKSATQQHYYKLKAKQKGLLPATLKKVACK